MVILAGRNPAEAQKSEIHDPDRIFTPHISIKPAYFTLKLVFSRGNGSQRVGFTPEEPFSSRFLLYLLPFSSYMQKLKIKPLWFQEDAGTKILKKCVTRAEK